MRFLSYLVLNGIVVTLLWLGLVEGVGGAQNLGLFAVWVISVSSLLFGTKEMASAVVKKGGFSAPYWFDVTFDICIVGLLAWYSCYWTASAYLFHIIMIGVLRSNVKEVMDETH